MVLSFCLLQENFGQDEEQINCVAMNVNLLHWKCGVGLSNR